uniref:URB2 ribosome biogenesis homolog n=1 Tax=Callorhinchus milii TaxID=7868 RepID=A0A4W3HNB5_CALMI|eukprot:gi/632953867/ref/XP_007892657.1/ PREDICTED: unhealthy ribosome biogenesis protein 2 homolog [Callorhinchus milii]
MAVAYSGIHLKLKSPKTPWQDKLKLARFAWISQQCFIPNKEQVLLDWVSHTLTGYHSKKLVFGDEIVAGLWTYLDDILHSVKLQKLIKEGRVVNLRFTVAQTINDIISECSSEEPPGECAAYLARVLSCCQSILSSPALCIIYTTKWEQLVDLLGKLSLLVCSRLKSSNALCSTQLLNVLLLTIHHYLVVQRQQHNQTRVFTQVSAHLLQPCLLLRHLLTVKSWAGEEDGAARHRLSKDIRNKIEEFLLAGLFHQDHLNSYPEELLQRDGADGKKKNAVKLWLLPVKEMLDRLGDSEFFRPDSHIAVVGSSMPLLYKLFLESYCKDENRLLCFHMLARLFHSFALPHVSPAAGENLLPVTPASALLALDQLLTSAFANDIYNIAVDKIQNHEVQFAFYSRVAETLLSEPQPTIPAWFRCLKTLVLLNHLIVEPRLGDLVSLAWINTNITDPQKRKAQDMLLGTLLQTYAKLRQLPRLFHEVLDAICRPVTELRQPVLSTVLTTKLRECLADLPPSQVLDIWDMILKKCHDHLIPDLEGNFDLAEKMFAVSVLLHSILFNMRSLDSKTPVPIRRRTEQLMQEMPQTVVLPLLNMVKDHGESSSPWAASVSGAGLLLAYTWVEVNTMLQLNCPSYVSPESQAGKLAEGQAMKEGDFHCLLAELDSNAWLRIVQVSRKNSRLNQHFLELLSLQKMKKIIMQRGERSEEDNTSLRSAAAFVVLSGKSTSPSGRAQVWDGELSTLSEETREVAHWYLVTSNLFLLFPYLSQEDTRNIADVVLGSLLREDLLGSGRDSLTVPAISDSLLRSPLLPEMPALHSAFISGLTERIGELVASSGNIAAAQLLRGLADPNIPWHEDFFVRSRKDRVPKTQLQEPQEDANSPQKLVEALAESILSQAKSSSPLALSEQQRQELLCALDQLLALQLDALRSADHIRCFLLLFTLATRLRPCSDQSHAVGPLQLLNKCYYLLTVLQTGRNCNSVFRVLHASDLLEAIVASLLSVSAELGAERETPAGLEFLGTFQTFLAGFLQVIIDRKQSMCLNLERFIHFLASFKAVFSEETKESGKPGPEQLLLLALSVLARVLITSLQQSERNQYASKALLALLGQVTGLMAPVLQAHLIASSGLDPAFYILSVTVLLEAELCLRTDSSLEQGDKTGSEEVKAPDQVELQYPQLYQSTCSRVLEELLSCGDDLESLRKRLDFLGVFSSALELCSDAGFENGVLPVLSAVKSLLAAPWMTVQWVQSLEPQLIEILTHLAERCTGERSYVMARVITQGFEVANLWKGQHTDVLAAVTLTRLFLRCRLDEDPQKAFWLVAPQIITSLLVLSKEAAQEPLLTCKIILPVLETLAILVRRGEGRLLNPQHVHLAFNTLLCVPLERLKLEDYEKVFEGIHEVLFSVLKFHPKVMLKAAPSFLNCFNRLVISIMHEGRQKPDREKGSSTENEAILRCALLVRRMYTHIASVTKEFTQFSPFIVAQYINELQKVTLHPDVKRHLTEGLYEVLDLCVDYDIHFINMSLQMGVREVFKALYSNYVRYHKTKRQGEEKYTA